MTQISIQFTRFSAFYSPLIATIAGGHLEDEGLEPVHSISPPGVSAVEALQDGSVQVVQSAPSASFGYLEKNKRPHFLHFAQINGMDGFFLTGRKPEPDFSWDGLKGKRVLVDHGGQPLAMFKYACHRRGLDFAALDVVNAGNAREMDAAFRAGEGDYIHQQGPAPQQLEHDGIGHIVAAVGEAVGFCAFSSLAAGREWLETDMARAFMRAYRKARAYVAETPAAEVARLEQPFFPSVPESVLENTVAAYQKLGNWGPPIEITREALEATLDIFEYNGRITRRHGYQDVVAQPPEG